MLLKNRPFSERCGGFICLRILLHFPFIQYNIFSMKNMTSSPDRLGENMTSSPDRLGENMTSSSPDRLRENMTSSSPDRLRENMTSSSPNRLMRERGLV